MEIVISFSPVSFSSVFLISVNVTTVHTWLLWLRGHAVDQGSQGYGEQFIWGPPSITDAQRSLLTLWFLWSVYGVVLGVLLGGLAFP